MWVEVEVGVWLAFFSSRLAHFNPVSRYLICQISFSGESRRTVKVGGRFPVRFLVYLFYFMVNFPRVVFLGRANFNLRQLI